MQGLEKNPLATVPMEPADLLDKTRYQTCRRTLSESDEARVALALAGIAQEAAKRGVLVKPAFDDASRDANSVRLINHVTSSQFKQVRAPSTADCAGMHITGGDLAVTL
jgi:hypothetical protein